MNSCNLAVKHSTILPHGCELGGDVFVGTLRYVEMVLGLARDKQLPPRSCTCSVLPLLPLPLRRSLTRGGSGGASLLWVLTFTGLHRPILFSLTCFLLLTTPILSESTEQIGDVSRSSEPGRKSSPKLLPGGQLERWVEVAGVGGVGGGSEVQSQNMESEGG